MQPSAAVPAAGPVTDTLWTLAACSVGPTAFLMAPARPGGSAWAAGAAALGAGASLGSAACAAATGVVALSDRATLAACALPSVRMSVGSVGAMAPAAGRVPGAMPFRAAGWAVTGESTLAAVSSLTENCEVSEVSDPPFNAPKRLLVAAMGLM